MFDVSAEKAHISAQGLILDARIVGDSFLSLTVLTLRGVAPVPTSTDNNFLESAREIPEIITNTGAKVVKFLTFCSALVIFQPPTLCAHLAAPSVHSRVLMRAGGSVKGIVLTEGP